MRKIGSPGAADRYEKMKKEREEEIGEKSKQKSYFDVLGLCCSSEVPLIEKILTPLQGVFDVSVIVPSKTVIVLHDPLLISQLQIVNELNKARLEANVKVYGQKNKKKRWPSPYAVASGVLLALSVTLKYVYHPLEFLALGAVAVGIIPMLFKAIASIRNFSLDINTLMILAVGGSIALRDYWEAGTIVFLFTTAEWLESRASHRATAAMSLLANIVPQTAVIAETGEQVKANQVLVNTVVAVKPGDVIPIDGVVVQGKCDVDEKTLTGESFPVSKQVDSTVWAGTINLNGYISVTTTARAEDCVVARMANLVEEAQKNKSKTQRFIDKGAKYYTPIVVAVSACIAISPLVFKVHNASERYHLALVVLVSACPCALILSTPVATCCGLSKAAKSGLLVKGGEYLETFSKIKIMAFDKTGTITKGEFVIMDFKPLLRDVDLNTLLYWVSSIESKSSHPMAAAIIDYAESHSIEPKADNVEDFQNFPGEGIFGKIDGKDIFVGNKRIAIRAGCATIPPLENDAKDRGKSIGYIFLGSSPAGVFSLSDVCRTGVKQAITELKTMGMKTAMLTGDSEAAANHAQAQLGGALQIVRAELLPEDKARIIKEFQTVSPTAMVGDGLNDAAALATADIGISMGISGSALAMDTGNIILMSNDIRKIPKCARLARRTRRKIFENMFLAIITKVAIIALAIAGHPLVWAAVLADVGTCLLVIFNSMLLLGIPKRNGGRTSAGHDHKHGIKSNHSHSPHIHKNCCSGTETGEKHKPQKCSSQKCATECHFETFSPASGKCATSSEKHGCCTNPSQAQEGKHNTAASNSISHSHKQCCSGNQAEKRGCSDIQAVKKCMPEVCPPKDQLDCSCQESCGNLKRLESAETHGCCEHNYEIIEEESHVNHGCCEHDEIIEEGKHINHGCCEHDEIIEGKHVNHGCENNDTLIEEEEHKSHGNHGCCEHDGRVDVEKHMDHGFHEELHSTKPNSCAEDKCMDSIEKGDGHCDELHKEKQGEHGSSGTKNHDADSHHHHNHHHDHDHPHHNHDHHHHIHPPHDHDHDHDHVGGSTEVGQHKHCHSDHHGNVRVHKEYITEEELSSMVKDCCKHGTEHGDISSSSSGKNHVECCTSSSSKVCSSLRKRHNGGCCQSFRRECCGASPQFEVGFRGGLSEIIID